MLSVTCTRKNAAVKHLLKSFLVNAMYVPNCALHKATSLAKAARSIALMALSPT